MVHDWRVLQLDVNWCKLTQHVKSVTSDPRFFELSNHSIQSSIFSPKKPRLCATVHFCTDSAARYAFPTCRRGCNEFPLYSLCIGILAKIMAVSACGNVGGLGTIHSSLRVPDQYLPILGFHGGEVSASHRHLHLSSGKGQTHTDRFFKAGWGDKAAIHSLRWV